MHELPIPAAIERALSGLPPAIRNRILERLQSLTDYEPVIGIAGKSGAGKSSLCNALFSGEVSPVSDVLACTRDALRFRLKADKHSLMIIDLPGAGKARSETVSMRNSISLCCRRWIWFCGLSRLTTGHCRLMRNSIGR